MVHDINFNSIKQNVKDELILDICFEILDTESDGIIEKASAPSFVSIWLLSQLRITDKSSVNSEFDNFFETFLVKRIEIVIPETAY